MRSVNSAKGGYSRLLETTFTETTRIVRDTHHAIARRTFDALGKAPVIGTPARLIEQAHTAISSSVYTAVHVLGGGVLGIAHRVEQQWFAEAAARLPVAVGSPLNAAFGDHLEASGSALAIRMTLRSAEQELILDRESLRAALPDAGRRIAVLIHGLGCSERSFAAPAPGIDLGQQLQQEFGLSPLYLRYNTGLPIERNGQLLAEVLEHLLQVWPQAAPDLLLIGHSMGGLVARSACEQAAAHADRWPLQTRMLIALGAPHAGAPMARHGERLQAALDYFDVSAPIGRVGSARSRGVKDLRDGLPGATLPRWPHIAYRFLGAHLGSDPGGPLARLFGDGLVPVDSSTTHASPNATERAVLADLGHLELPSDPRAWAQIRAWIEDLP